MSPARYQNSRLLHGPPLRRTSCTHIEVFFKLNLVCCVTDICQLLGHMKAFRC
jgi:hypothetical protein